jgi:hypothetical protein
MVIYITAPPKTKSPKKSFAASIPLRHGFTSCHIVTSHRTRVVCLFIRLFVPLVGCCIVSLPLAVALSPGHAVPLSSLIVRRPHRVVASSRRHVLSHLVVVSCTLTQLVTPDLFDCRVYCRHRTAADTVAVAVPPPPQPPCRAVLLPPPPRRRALSRSHSHPSSCRYRDSNY